MQLIKLIQVHREYPIEQIDLALDKLINDETEFLTNANGTVGRLVNVGKYYRFQSLELLETNTSHFDISRPIEFKPPGKYFNLEDKEVEKSSLLIEDNKNINVVIDELLTNMNIHYHNLQLNIDYGSKKVKANTLNWYQQAAIAIHLIIQSNTSFDLNALYRVCIHHFIEQLTMEQHRLLLHYLDKNEDKDKYKDKKKNKETKKAKEKDVKGQKQFSKNEYMIRMSKKPKLAKKKN